MIKITNEFDGKKYELVIGVTNCKSCAFCNSFEDYYECTEDQAEFNGILLCDKLNGIWKEVKDAD